ncbi:branched-chain amino acid ABC transporter ATP-binding protein/permease [Reyranella sp.]|jgi:branched-chain amino acid transport system permease protein|uniref:branched-chain amino acid ABC transporter ATP-binding protein/permease n=1 Tax=Reyranella sp. TaxID=1929291 RepID=UPI002F95E09C
MTIQAKLTGPWPEVASWLRARTTLRTQHASMACLLLVALLFPPLINNDGDVDAAANALSFAALALGLNIVVGFAGLLDLGYAAFFAIGAYAYGALASWQLHPAWSSFWVPFQWLDLVSEVDGAVHFQVSFWLMLPISAAIAAFFGILFGAPTLRLKGDYLAIVTLGFGEIVPIVARNSPTLTNGAQGLNGVLPPVLFGYQFGVDATPYYYVGLALVVFLMFTSQRLKMSRIGRAWMAIREDEIGAAAMGVDRVRYKLMAFAIGAAFAGATGTLYVAKLQTATPEMFMFPVSVMLLVMIVFGGMGNVWGVVVGALILQILQSWLLQDLSGWLQALGELINVEWLQHVDLSQSIELIFGIILVLMMLYRRQGLIPASRRVAGLSLDEQAAQVSRGGFDALAGLGSIEERRTGPLLEIEGLTVRFGGLVALRSVSLSVPAHGIVAVIGPNGSGKSTLFNAVTGLLRADSGSVRFAGQQIAGMPAHRILKLGIARTFQNLRLFPNLTVLENVLVGMHSRLRTGLVGAVVRPPGTNREEHDAQERALEILSVFGNRLVPRINHVVSSLSYANRRRAEIARAIATRPKLLLLDEPTAGMNPAETLELADQIKSLNRLGLTIVLIEHKLDVVVNLADNVVVLDHGEVIASGPPDVVRRDEEVIRAYLGRSANVA